MRGALRGATRRDATGDLLLIDGGAAAGGAAAAARAALLIFILEAARIYVKYDRKKGATDVFGVSEKGKKKESRDRGAMLRKAKERKN